LNALRHKKTYEQMFETQATRFARRVASFHCHALSIGLAIQWPNISGPGAAKPLVR
jgi:hypothetical protein